MSKYNLARSLTRRQWTEFVSDFEIPEEPVLPEDVLLGDLVPPAAHQTRVEQVPEITEVENVEQDILVQSGPHPVQDTIGEDTEG